jgi:hypothetical protein
MECFRYLQMTEYFGMHIQSSISFCQGQEAITLAEDFPTSDQYGWWAVCRQVPGRHRRRSGSFSRSTLMLIKSLSNNPAISGSEKDSSIIAYDHHIGGFIPDGNQRLIGVAMIPLLQGRLVAKFYDDRVLVRVRAGQNGCTLSPEYDLGFKRHQ